LKSYKLPAAVLALCAVLFAVNSLWLKGRLPFFTGYFNDILAGCVLMAATNLLLALAGLRPMAKLWHCLALTVSAGLFWEYVTPLYLSRSVSDPLDIAAYAAGGIIWYIVFKSVKRKC